MVKIFIVLQLIQFENRIEVVSNKDEHFVVYKANVDYEYIDAMLKLAQKRVKPVFAAVGDHAEIHKIELCKQLIVTALTKGEEHFKVLFLPMAGVYKADSKNIYLLDILNQSFKLQKAIWVGIDSFGNIVAAYPNSNF